MREHRYLYEIIEDYKESTSPEEKGELFQEFCSGLWGSKNKRRTYAKSIRFRVRNDLINTELGQIFNTWSVVDYRGYKAMSQTDDWYDLIRQKVNNLYTKYFDKEVILAKEYMDLLRVPKTMYFRWIKGYLDVTSVDTLELVDTLDNAIHEAQIVKAKLQKQKIEMSWREYQKIIEKFLRNIFDNCMILNEYESKHGVPNFLMFNEFAIEDNFYVKYICKSLDAYMMNWQKEYHGLKRGRNKKYMHCDDCGRLIEKTGNKKKFCEECALKRKKESDKISDKKYKNKKRENRNSEFSQ